MAYVLEFVDDVNEEDEVFEDHGVKVIIDSKSLVYLDGTQLDYVKEGLNEGFEFNNPNAKKRNVVVVKASTCNGLAFGVTRLT